jgi:hypothetical protein
MQLSLTFPDTPLPEEQVWSQLSPAEQTAAIELVAGLLAKAVIPATEPEVDHE